MSRISNKIIDYYKVLGIDETSSTEDIRRAYLKLAKKYHPDKNGNNEVSLIKFTLVNEAYNILGNLENRLKYKIEIQTREQIREQAAIKLKLKKRDGKDK